MLPFNDLRWNASQCLERARKLLAAGDEWSVRYACLELRFCIEYVTFDQLVAYLAEVDGDALKKWTPKQIIDTLREVDPAADRSRSVAFGLGDDGAPPADRRWMEDRRFSGEWANANHNALGNFLHASTLEQIESGRVVPLTTMVRKATSVAEMLASILSSPVFHANFGVFYELECRCGARIKRREGGVKEQGIVCPRESCRAIYDVVSRTEEQVTFRVRTRPYRCEGCRSVNRVETHLIREGAAIECPTCGTRFKVELSLVRVKEAGPAEECPAT